MRLLRGPARRARVAIVLVVYSLIVVTASPGLDPFNHSIIQRCPPPLWRIIVSCSLTGTHSPRAALMWRDHVAWSVGTATAAGGVLRKSAVAEARATRWNRHRGRASPPSPAVVCIDALAYGSCGIDALTDGAGGLGGAAS